MGAFGRLLAIIMSMFLLATSSINGVSAADPDPVQDICVADLKSPVKINGFPCKINATPEDFFSAVLAKPGDTDNAMGSNVTAANVQQIPGLNTLGVSLARIDYAPKGGLNPPHTHPRATELVFVLEGELDVGFITTANILFYKKIKKGDIYTFPKGLVHFQINNGDVPAAVLSAFNSQLPGVQVIATTLFAAKPPVPENVLAKAFQIDVKIVEEIEAKFAPPKY